IRRVGPFAVMYAPKGPVLDYADAECAAEVIDHLQDMARRHRALWLKIDPDVPAATGIPNQPDDTPNFVGQALMRHLHGSGWRFSADQVQFRNTIVLDLTRSQD